MKRGEIWLVNMEPSFGHEIQKVRPAVSVQNDIGNIHSPTTIVVPLTSQHLELGSPVEVVVQKQHGIIKPSKIQFGRLFFNISPSYFTLPHKLIKKKFISSINIEN